MRLKLSLSVYSILLIGIVVIAYICTKASVSSFTHDESYSYLRYVHIGFMDIISHVNTYTNNHLLNSLLMKYSEILFGTSEFSLRLPNLVMLLIYMFYCYLLFRKTNPFLAVGIFLILCTNNTLIDLFGLARGYGLSIGFMVMSLYHFIESFHNNKLRNTILFHLGGLLAVLSNFTLLDFYVALLLIYNLIIIMDCKFISKTKYQMLKVNKLHFIPFLFVLGVLYEPVRRVIKYNNLDFGGKNGFYNDTVRQLIYYCFHVDNLSPILFLLAQLVFTVIILFSTDIIIRKMLKGDGAFYRDYKGLIISNFLLLFVSLAIVFQHILFKADYPILRFSIYLFPLFIIHLAYFISYLTSLTNGSIIPKAMLALGIISAISFGITTDLYSCAEWSYDRETKNMIQKLMEEKGDKSPDTTSKKMGINWLFEPTINFYRETRGIHWLQPVDRNGLTADDDYYYIFKDELNKLNPNEYKVINEYKETNTLLLINTKKQ